MQSRENCMPRSCFLHYMEAHDLKSGWAMLMRWISETTLRCTIVKYRMIPGLLPLVVHEVQINGRLFPFFVWDELEMCWGFQSIQNRHVKRLLQVHVFYETNARTYEPKAALCAKYSYVTIWISACKTEQNLDYLASVMRQVQNIKSGFRKFRT